MNILVICIILVVVYYFYKKSKNKKGEGGYVTPKASFGKIVQFTDSQLQAASAKNPERDSFGKIKELETKYGASSLREGLNALLSNILLKGKKTLSGKTGQAGRQVAETIAAIDNQYVLPVFRGNSDDYRDWWLNALLVLNCMIVDNPDSPQQSALWMDLTEDIQQVDDLLEEKGILEKMEAGTLSECSLSIDNPQTGFYRNIKLKYRKSSGIGYYEMTGGYKYFSTDLHPDMITSLVETFIAAVAKMQFPSGTLWRVDLEKYGLPGAEKFARMQ